MNRKPPYRNRVAILLLAVATASDAVTTGILTPAPAGVAPPRPSSGKQEWGREATKSMADDSSGLRKGTIEAVDVGHGTFHVYGQQLNFEATKLKVFGRDGKPTNVYALQRGTIVRFTLDPADPKQRRVAVVYVE